MPRCEASRRSLAPALLVIMLFAPSVAIASCECSPCDRGEAQPACGPNGTLAFVTLECRPPFGDFWATLVAGPAFSFGSWAVLESPTWASDGNRVAFGLGGTGIYILTRGQPEPVLVPGSAFGDGGPSWSQQGGTIAFGRDGEVWAMNEDGSSRRQITSLGDCWAPAVSPDGTQIAFGRGLELWVQALAPGASPRHLTNGARPAWAPNGKWIAFDSDRAGNRDVWVIAVSGGTAVRLTSGADSESDPSWSSDGTKIVYTVTTSGCQCLEWLDTPPDYTVDVQPCTWSQVKGVYR
jgi:Tol biopolymer transport system component